MPPRFPWSKSSKHSSERRQSDQRAEFGQPGNYNPSAPRQLFSPEPPSHAFEQQYHSPIVDHHNRQEGSTSLRHNSVDDETSELGFRHEASQSQPHTYEPSPTSSTEGSRTQDNKKSVRARFGLRNKSREALAEPLGHHHFLSRQREGQAPPSNYPYHHSQEEEGTLASASSGQLSQRLRQDSRDPSVLEESTDPDNQSQYYDNNDYSEAAPDQSHHQHSVSKTSINQYQPYSGPAASQQPSQANSASYTSSGPPSQNPTTYQHQAYQVQSAQEVSSRDPREGDSFASSRVSPEVTQVPIRRGDSLLRKQVPSGSSFVQRAKGPGQEAVEGKELLGMPSKSNSLSVKPQRSPTSASQPSPAIGSRSGQFSGSNLQRPAQAQDQDFGRRTPPSANFDNDMSEQDVEQLTRDYRELRDKYSKVKRYYFEKDAQVQQLQNALAHQKLSQSRTSLDDGEYVGRLTRLDGLIAQLAFGFRKDWKEVPFWLQSFVNKDALSTGKQEMTAVGRAFISQWIVEEVFQKYFHPGLDPEVSITLQVIQRSLRRNAPVVTTDEEVAALTDKILNWRMATMEGLRPFFASPESSSRRQALIEMLNVQLVSALHEHMHDPPPAGLEGGVNMIIELVVVMLTHLHAESRDVQIDYFTPGTMISADLMKVETGIPSLVDPIAELPEFDKRSVEINVSDTDLPASSDNITLETEAGAQQEQTKKGFLGSIMGSKKAGGSNGSSDAQKTGSATASQNDLLQPPGSAGGDSMGGRVRFAVLPSLQIRGKAVLYKAPVYRI